ncbi:MAG: glycosyltransferase [Comamonadaceae bacterium]|nr:glycosyltransferase [Comamonadaceae bacterium]
MSDGIKLGFVLLSNTQNAIPSTRIVVLNMLPYLRAAGFDPHIVFEPATSTKTPNVAGVAEKIKAGNFQVVVLQKVFGDSVLELARELRQAGIKTVFAICDFVNPVMCEATDATIVVTDYLKSLYPKELQPKVAVVHDGVERPERQKTAWNNHDGSRARPLNAVLVTSAALDHLPLLESLPAWLKVTIVGSYSAPGFRLQRWKENYWQMVNKNGWANRWRYLRFLANPRIACEAWGPDSVYDALERADFGIIPIKPDPMKDPTGEWKLKSENRLTLKMAMGLPVVATPIPSYEPVIEEGVNGFLARSQGDWVRCLSALRDPDARQAIGRNARNTALSGYSKDFQAQRFIEVLRSVVSGDSLSAHGLNGSLT